MTHKSYLRFINVFRFDDKDIEPLKHLSDDALEAALETRAYERIKRTRGLFKGVTIIITNTGDV